MPSSNVTGKLKDTELIGPETRATGAANFQSIVQFFDPVFDIAPLTIHFFIEPLRTLLHVGHHEARVILGFALPMPHHCGFIDDALYVNNPG